MKKWNTIEFSLVFLNGDNKDTRNEHLLNTNTQIIDKKLNARIIMH